MTDENLAFRMLPHDFSFYDKWQIWNVLYRWKRWNSIEYADAERKARACHPRQFLSACISIGRLFLFSNIFQFNAIIRPIILSTIPHLLSQKSVGERT